MLSKRQLAPPVCWNLQENENKNATSSWERVPFGYQELFNSIKTRNGTTSKGVVRQLMDV